MRSLFLCASILNLFLVTAITLAAPSVDPLKPYTGPTSRGVDTSTLDGKVMCGYQGWFNVPADGMQRGFRHWSERGNEPLVDGNVHVDLWPDLSEFSASELYATDLKFSDGRAAKVYSAANRASVMRHFRWMREYGIDGAFVQRFAGEIRDPVARHSTNVVLDHCRAAANANGRAYVVMYDLSGLGANETQLIIDDWTALRRDARITDDPAYLHHHGKPLVAVWGIGFNDNRPYSLDDCRTLVDFFKKDGCTVMVGVPTYWRTLDRDTVNDPKLHEVIARADVVSPWTVGRYDSPDAATTYAKKNLKADIDWCSERKLDYLPVVFPGFSWHNMHGGTTKTDQIPRRGGEFLWSQFVNVKNAGAKSAYVAMFDEIDEGTAIFKLAPEGPNGAKSKFVSMAGLPSDFYLRVVGAGAELIRGEREAAFPVKAP